MPVLIFRYLFQGRVNRPHGKEKGPKRVAPTPPFLVLRNGSQLLADGAVVYQEAWKPARAPTSPESKPTPTPPVKTVLSLMR